jgi:hypothetical protein
MWELGAIGIGEQGAYAGLRRSSKRNTPTAAAQPAGISTTVDRIGVAGRTALTSAKEFRRVGKRRQVNRHRRRRGGPGAQGNF